LQKIIFLACELLTGRDCMARPLRIEFPGGNYHVTSRGNARQNIFVDDRDRQCFLSLLSHVSQRSRWLVYAYCLMPNHYHVLLEITDRSLSSGMRLLNGTYSQRFNRNHKRVGHLLQGRFKSIVVDKESYQLELSRYIVLNPVRAGIASEPGDWKWSSYKAMMGQAPRPGFLRTEPILRLFGSEIVEARRRFARFVYGGIDKDPPWDELKGGLYLGDERFVRRIGKLLGKKRGDREYVKSERFSDRPTLDSLLPHDTPRPVDSRTLDAVCKARDIYGYSLKDIADFLCLHSSTLTKAIRRTRADITSGTAGT
jgi:REP element-mobilizing transposase RayT